MPGDGVTRGFAAMLCQLASRVVPFDLVLPGAVHGGWQGTAFSI